MLSPQGAVSVFRRPLLKSEKWRTRQLLWDTLIYSEWVATLDGHMMPDPALTPTSTAGSPMLFNERIHA
jgi:hypothetical protein